MFFEQGIWKVVANAFTKRSISLFTKHFISTVVASLKKIGLKRSIMVFLSFLGDFTFDIRYGTDTVGRLMLADLEITSENGRMGSNYVPTRAKPFKKLMNSLNFPDNSIFVDFGSGKGRVLLLASQYPFKRVVGIEFSHDLCQVAKKNISLYREQQQILADVEIVETDVVDYEIKDDDNVFFLFHPFNEIVLTKVLRNINMSLQKKHRKIWLIYNNPVHHDVIEKQGNFLKLEEFLLGGNQFIVYMNNFEQSSKKIAS